MPDDMLDELERLLELATPGPWRVHHAGPGECANADGQYIDGVVPSIAFVNAGPATADLIVEAVNALPRLIAIARAAQKWKDGIASDDEWTYGRWLTPSVAHFAGRHRMNERDAKVYRRWAMVVLLAVIFACVTVSYCVWKTTGGRG